MPEEIREIVEAWRRRSPRVGGRVGGGGLSLSVGVVAQRYVARRMGVGEGGMGKGKRRMDAVMEDGGGEGGPRRYLSLRSSG